MSSIYDLSCFTPECLSIGKTAIGQIIFDNNTDPIKCNCIIFSNEINSNITNNFPDINILPINPITPTMIPIPPQKNNTDNSPTEIPNIKVKNNITKNNMVLSIVLLLWIIIL